MLDTTEEKQTAPRNQPYPFHFIRSDKDGKLFKLSRVCETTFPAQPVLHTAGINHKDGRTQNPAVHSEQVQTLNTVYNRLSPITITLIKQSLQCKRSHGTLPAWLGRGLEAKTLACG